MKNVERKIRLLKKDPNISGDDIHKLEVQLVETRIRNVERKIDKLNSLTQN